MRTKKSFMKGKWENLCILTFPISEKELEPFLPKGVELDFYNGKALISLVAFTFSKVRMYEFQIPFHQFFPEINIRTYVKNDDGEKGVLFLQEMTAKYMVNTIGKWIYNEPFQYQKLSYHQTDHNFQYGFINEKNKQTIDIEIESNTVIPKDDISTFIIDRKTAFVKTKNNNYNLYYIKRNPWNVLPIKTIQYTDVIRKLFPKEIQNLVDVNTPISQLFVDGSWVEVRSSS